MKTTVELPQTLFERTKSYGATRGMTFKDVLIQALGLLIGEAELGNRPAWEELFGAFPALEMKEIQEEIDAGFSNIDLEDWK